MKEMKEYRNPAIQITTGNDFYVAGVSVAYNNRPMTIMKGRITDTTRLNLQGVLVVPDGFDPSEKDTMRVKAERSGFRIKEIQEIPLALAEFYSMQERISADDRQLLVVYLEEHSDRVKVDVTYLEHEERIGWICDGLWELKKQTSHMEIHKCSGNREADLEHIYRAVYLKLHGICQRKFIRDGVVMFAGSEALSETLAARLKKEEPLFQRVLAYKPENAPVLGAAMCSRERRPFDHKFSVPADKTAYYRRNIWSSYNDLSPLQKNAYWTLIEAATEHRDEARCEWSNENISVPMKHICRDYPELELYWKAYDSKCYVEKAPHRKEELVCQMKYSEHGFAKLAAVKTKAEEILRSCTAHPSNGYLSVLSDEETFRNIYRYFCQNYEYCKSGQDSNGNYPRKSYTLEAILGNGVCQGYSFALIYLLRTLQIPVRFIHGRGEPTEKLDHTNHAWVMTQLSDGLSCKHTDVTWGICNSAYSSKVTEKYLWMDDVQVQILNHSWSRSEYPSAASDI